MGTSRAVPRCSLVFVEIQYKVVIEVTAPVVTPDAVSFETGATRAQVSEPAGFVYDHHGAEFGQTDPGALTTFYEELLLGRGMPQTFVTKAVKDVDTLTALTLFLHRDLPIQERTPGFVAAVDLVHRRGLPVVGHFDMDLVRFFRLLRMHIQPDAVPKRVLGERLQTAVSWIREYLMVGKLPSLGPEFAPVEILDHGSDGFVVGKATGSLLEAWVIAYRMGFLRGVIIRPAPEERSLVLASRKSIFAPFNLEIAANLLNEVETAMGETPGWRTEGDWLWGPTKGTLLPLPQMLEVFLRV